MFSAPQNTTSELQQYNYFVMQEPVFEEKIEELVFTHVYEENGVLYCASQTSEGVYCYTYCLNNPLIYTDPSGYFYGPVEPGERQNVGRDPGGGATFQYLYYGSSRGTTSSNGWDFGNLDRSYGSTTSFRPTEAGYRYDDNNNWMTWKAENITSDDIEFTAVPVFTSGNDLESRLVQIMYFEGDNYFASDYFNPASNGGDGFDIQHETQAYARLTDAERALARNNQGAALIVYRNMNRATDATKALFSGAIARNDAADAFRHAYFSALNARALGYDPAFQFGVAHEQFPGNDPFEMQMDLSNNIFVYNLTVLSPGMSNAQMRGYIYNAVQSGELLMLYQGRIVPTR
jgi:Domain of unknown function (DUF6973)